MKMCFVSKSLTALAVVAAVGTAVVGLSSQRIVRGECSNCVASKDIVDTAIAAGSFKTLVAAVQAAGLVETLKGTGPFTVFAPTDEAFAKLPAGTLESLLKPENKDQLVKILTYHVVAGKVMAADVVKLDSAKTVEGGSLAIKVTDGKVFIDNAQVIKTDIATTNGVIHVIDAVVLPK
jgi:transforming growth factor-beta-induced protein